MSFEESDSDPDPFDVEADAEGEGMPGEDPDPEPAWNPLGLRNTEPKVGPGEIGQELDWQAQWWQHLGAGMVKQTGQNGIEAWHHYVIALIQISITLHQGEQLDMPRPAGSSREDDEQESNGGHIPKDDLEPGAVQGPLTPVE